MKYPILIAIIMVLCSCTPELQRDVFLGKKQQLADIKQFCNESTAKESNPNTAAINCGFTASESLLSEAGFKDMDLLYKLNAHYLDIARQQDAKIITKENADILYAQANKEFSSAVQRRDNIRWQRYYAAMAAMGDGLQSAGNGLQSAANAHATAANAYSNAAASPIYNQQPMAVPSVPVNNLSDSLPYVQESYKPNPYNGVGAVGYDGRRYIPVDPSLTPGLTPNGYAR